MRKIFVLLNLVSRAVDLVIALVRVRVFLECMGEGGGRGYLPLHVVARRSIPRVSHTSIRLFEDRMSPEEVVCYPHKLSTRLHAHHRTNTRPCAPACSQLSLHLANLQACNDTTRHGTSAGTRKVSCVQCSLRKTGSNGAKGILNLCSFAYSHFLSMGIFLLCLLFFKFYFLWLSLSLCFFFFCYGHVVGGQCDQVVHFFPSI